ncbi:methionyl-tRNA formyltransferase [Legionella jordanis]|uniref:Methionyl-tRNA formyltransferase n=1 Tax=Legionella jordanis TaxID=456 RepID=A0A0W0VDS0_9GAMM|nr:methionyl-tRNA formyltransferase [Legionella jordanis]KTD18223.1 methionyl tRNA formyltransferase [Legionella jordanis]RMX01181.1 methionyl-tRNA formyltransferase [Legionella jordanis]RMX21411.1 methionyl-tRNA formyltransferase [Legionella jordanis]VEH13684.1 methionyl-tRNA formyltransferase [Legionella jordanis]HAT8714605.1 methionyl-tRNA formyltransferase [Legionella jordanis]
MNIVFAGTPEFTLPALDALAKSRHPIMAVYTQPDRPAGRGRKLQPSAVKSWAISHQLPIYQPLNFKSEETVGQLEALKPDVMIVIAYGLILPKKVLGIPKLGCINVHASLLPHWRGASPIQHAILHGDNETGVTIMQMDEGMDTGAMLAKARCPIFPEDTAGTLHDRLAELAVEPLLRTLDDLENNRVQPQPQNHSLASYAGKISKDDAQIDWQQSALDIHNKIRAFNPWPIAYTRAGDDLIRIHYSHVEDCSFEAVPGTILSLDRKGMLVATGKQALMIEKIQFPGGKILSVADYLNANRSQLQVNVVLK